MRLAGWLADLAVVFHLAFILFVVLGGLAVLRWPRLAWVHLPCALWGAAAELTGWVCPLTPLENWLRGLAGEASYRGGFIEHYLIPVVYPAGLTPRIQIVLGLLVTAINTAVYASWHRRRRAARRRAA